MALLILWAPVCASSSLLNQILKSTRLPRYLTVGTRNFRMVQESITIQKETKWNYTRTWNILKHIFPRHPEKETNCPLGHMFNIVLTLCRGCDVIQTLEPSPALGRHLDHTNGCAIFSGVLIPQNMPPKDFSKKTTKSKSMILFGSFSLPPCPFN